MNNIDNESYKRESTNPKFDFWKEYKITTFHTNVQEEVKAQFTNTRNEKGEITTDSTVIKKQSK